MPKKTTKPKFPFWVLRLTNTELTVLEDALSRYQDDSQTFVGVYTKIEEEAVDRMLAAVQKVIAKRRERRGKAE